MANYSSSGLLYLWAPYAHWPVRSRAGGQAVSGCLSGVSDMYVRSDQLRCMAHMTAYDMHVRSHERDLCQAVRLHLSIGPDVMQCVAYGRWHAPSPSSLAANKPVNAWLTRHGSCMRSVPCLQGVLGLVAYLGAANAGLPLSWVVNK